MGRNSKKLNKQDWQQELEDYGNNNPLPSKAASSTRSVRASRFIEGQVVTLSKLGKDGTVIMNSAAALLVLDAAGFIHNVADHEVYSTQK